MGMFIMSKYYVTDVIDAAKVIKSKINCLEVEMKALVEEQLKLMKAYSVVENKLQDMCSHEWEKMGDYQFAPIVCQICGVEKRKF